MHPPGTKGRTDGWAWRGDPYASAGAAAAVGAVGVGGAGYGSAAEGTGSEGYETTSSLD